MDDVHEIKQHQSHSKIAIFAIVGFLVFVTVAILVISKATQNEKAYVMQSKASETALGGNELRANSNTSDASKTEGEIITSPSGCRYTVQVGMGLDANKFICSNQCPVGSTSCTNYTCYISAVIKCLDDGAEYRFRGECQQENIWKSNGEAVCCRDKAIEYAQRAGFGPGDKQICDAICRRAGGQYCELEQPIDQENPRWRCPALPTPTSGGGAGLPITTPPNR